MGDQARKGQTGIRVLILVALLVGLLVSSCFDLNHASAQTTTRLFFSPDPGSIYLNGTNSLVVDLLITDAVDANAFEINLIYDPGIARISSWSHGGFLSAVMCLVNVNDPGFLRLACVQLAQPGKSGDGTLLKLTFNGTGYGSTSIDFAYARVSNKDSQSTFPETDNGLLNTVYDPAIIKNSSLTGDFSLQGQLARGGIPVRLEVGAYVGFGPYTTTSLEQEGTNVTFASVVLDAYLVTTNQPRYLNLDASTNKIKGILTTPGVLSPLVLLSGNAVWTDNEINVADLSLVGADYGKTGSTWNADVNFDGIVNIRDLALVAGNYGLTSSTAYETWIP